MEDKQKKSWIRTKRKSQFVAGHAAWNRRDDTAATRWRHHTVGEDGAQTSTSSAEQPSQDPLEIRKDTGVFTAALHNHRGDPDTLPTRLRPKTKERSDIFEGSDDENFVVSRAKLCELLELCMMHNNACLAPTAELLIPSKRGLCISAEARCRRCAYTTGVVKLYTECKQRGRGPATGELNEGLAMCVSKTKVGPSDVQFMLGCLNIRVPSMTNIYRTVNRQCDQMTVINQISMVENQEFVKEVTHITGGDVEVETDTSYNNRQHAGWEAATAAFSPIIEKTTGKNLILELATANKLCMKKQCDHQNENCKKTYGTDESISSSEGKLLRKNILKIAETKVLNVDSITSDACAQVEKVTRELSASSFKPIRYYQCFIHRLRTLQKHLKNVSLGKLPPGYNKDIYKPKLASAIRMRVRLELVRIHKVHAEQHFITKAQAALGNIVQCFSGNHTQCRQNSLSCCSHLASFSTQHLPYGNYLNLGAEDKQKIQNILNKTFSLANLGKMSRLHTTNQCESLHHRVFTYAPKTTLWSRNFDALCHSAAHSSTFGTGRSTLLLARARGLKFSKSHPMFEVMTRRDLIAHYHARRKQTRQYKVQRHYAKCKKANRKLRQASMYANAPEDVCNIHDYGLRPDSNM